MLKTIVTVGTVLLCFLSISCVPITTEKNTKLEKSEVISINYPTRDYTVADNELTDADKYEKHAFVYLPKGYNPEDSSTKYPVFLLMHGNSCSEYTWGLDNPYGEIKKYLDDGMANGDVKKFIVVAANGVADKTWKRKGQDSSYLGVLNFGKELRNDLLPYLRENFNILDGRENVAMAGFSMGAEQTMTIGIGECLDLISYFGAFSSIPFSVSFHLEAPVKDPLEYINDVEKTFPDKNLGINLLYMICGTNDGFYYGYSLYEPVMPTWDRIKKFESEAVKDGEHDFGVWNKAFEHYIKMIF